MRRDRGPARPRHRALRDLLAVTALTALAYAWAARSDVGERLHRWLDGHKGYEFDEMAIALIALTLGLSVFSLLWSAGWRREAAARTAIESRYRQLVEQVPAITYIRNARDDAGTDSDSYVSPQIQSVLGYTVDEWEADPGIWLRQLHSDDRGRVISEWRRSLGHQGPFRCEYRIHTKDGSLRWLRDEAILVAGEGGSALVQGIMFDITERRRADEQLRETEAQYRKLVEQLPAVVYLDSVDELSTALFVSSRYEDLTGYTPAERVSNPDLWVRMLHPDDREWVLAESERTNETGDPFACEYRLIRKDGRVIWIRDEATLVSDEKGGPLVWQGVLLDITQQKEAEETVRRREAILPAVGFAAQRFLKSPAWEQSIDAVLRHLGEAADVSRVRLWTNRRDEEGELRSTVRFEWTAPGIRQSVSDPWAEDFSLEATGHGRWAEALAAGEIVCGRRQDLPEAEQRFLEAWEIRSLVVVPVFVAGEWWGFIGFNDCVSDREWSSTEIEALRAAADILGTAVNREEALLRLADAEAHFRTLVEQLPAVTYIDTTDEPPETLYISPQVEGMLGYTPEEWKGDPALELRRIHPDDRERVLAEDDRTDTSGEPFKIEYRFLAKDGRTVWLREEATLVRDADGAPRFWQGILFDITELKQAEELIRQAEERFRAIVETVPAVLYVEVPDPKAPTIYISPQVEELLGITAEQYMAHPEAWEQMVHPDDREEAVRHYEGGLAANEAWSMDYRIVRPDGRELWIRDESTLLHDEHGETHLVQGVMYDITERKVAEQALAERERREREAADRLRALDDMKNTFLAAVSHELRSPLTSILGLSLTLERQDRLTEEDRADLLGRLGANARKLDRLLKDLLDIDRLSRGIVEPQYRLVDVGALIRRTIESFDSVGDRTVAVRTESVLIRVDPAKVERIVENLVMNAVRHTSDDSMIWVRVGPRGGGALIVVEDDGPGVPEEMRSEIFQPFRQGPQVSRANPGTGIGLSLVARFAELHGGRAWVGDREGGGASFSVFLPGAREQDGTGREEGSSGLAGDEHAAVDAADAG